MGMFAKPVDSGTHDASPGADVAVVVLSLFAGLATFIACQAWHQRITDRWNKDFVPSLTVMMPPPHYPWLSAHAILSAFIAFAVVIAIGRVWLFMLRMEHHQPS